MTTWLFHLLIWMCFIQLCMFLQVRSYGHNGLCQFFDSEGSPCMIYRHNLISGQLQVRSERILYNPRSILLKTGTIFLCSDLLPTGFVSFCLTFVIIYSRSRPHQGSSMYSSSSFFSQLVLQAKITKTADYYISTITTNKGLHPAH